MTLVTRSNVVRSWSSEFTGQNGAKAKFTVSEVCIVQRKIGANSLGRSRHHCREAFNPIQIDLKRVIVVIRQRVAATGPQRAPAMNSGCVDQQQRTRLRRIVLTFDPE